MLRKGPVLAIILASYTMIVLDISIVITALPQIQRELGVLGDRAVVGPERLPARLRRPAAARRARAA